MPAVPEPQLYKEGFAETPLLFSNKYVFTDQKSCGLHWEPPLQSRSRTHGPYRRTGLRIAVTAPARYTEEEGAACPPLVDPIIRIANSRQLLFQATPALLLGRLPPKYLTSQGGLKPKRGTPKHTQI